MNKNTLVSVIIPTYNRARWLKVAVESVLKQTYPYFELLILDNFSTDDTPELVASYNDPRIKYLRHQCNIGGWANWNYGFYLAKGEYLSILCDDDFYKPDFLETRINTFAKYNNLQAVFSNYELCDKDGKITSSVRKISKTEEIISGVKLLACVTDHNWFIGATLFKREIVLTYAEEILRGGKAADTFLKVCIALNPKNQVAWINNLNLVNRQHSNQDSVIGGNSILIGHIAAFNEPLIFGSYTWRYRRLLKKGAAWAYDILGRSSWDAGEIRVARRCFLRQLAGYPLAMKVWLRLFRCLVPLFYLRLSSKNRERYAASLD